jgi:hypothetical protein
MTGPRFKHLSALRLKIIFSLLSLSIIFLLIPAGCRQDMLRLQRHHHSRGPVHRVRGRSSGHEHYRLATRSSQWTSQATYCLLTIWLTDLLKSHIKGIVQRDLTGVETRLKKSVLLSYTVVTAGLFFHKILQTTASVQ